MNSLLRKEMSQSWIAIDLRNVYHRAIEYLMHGFENIKATQQSKHMHNTDKLPISQKNE